MIQKKRLINVLQISSLLNMGSKIGQPHIKQYKVEFSRIGKLNPSVEKSVELFLSTILSRALKIRF